MTIAAIVNLSNVRKGDLEDYTVFLTGLISKTLGVSKDQVRKPTIDQSVPLKATRPGIQVIISLELFSETERVRLEKKLSSTINADIEVKFGPSA